MPCPPPPPPPFPCLCSYSEQLEKWIEVGNSGMFRPEMLRPMGLPEGVNVIAWGLGLERCACRAAALPCRRRGARVRWLCGRAGVAALPPCVLRPVSLASQVVPALFVQGCALPPPPPPITPTTTTHACPPLLQAHHDSIPGG